MITAARELFAGQGFAATGTEEIVSRARVTRGALYHHFKDKTDLFRAVMEEVATEMAESLIDRELQRAREDVEVDAWDQLCDGIHAFLDVCLENGDFQRVMLVDGPSVFGHEAWDGLVEKHGYSLLAQWLEKAMEEGRIARLPVAPLTRMMAGLISEASLYMARCEDPVQGRDDAGVVVDRLLSGLQVP
ncbi:TetR/AcrR family transcriptional regulator [Mangrovactinospora gilvigrisea]|uniref:TetR/AcrR family transcriptional regulator n=1 Tax=Mangrovactinospora gilvigrisea TaxID=1428644 RepID=UPI001FEC5A4D|nr:TetR/AcrR family transcriptional regulator [Mangrovactinospora gilvigrisea]